MCRINRRQFLQSLAASAAFVSMSDKSETEYKRDNSKEEEMDSKTLVTYWGKAFMYVLSVRTIRV